MIAPRFFIFIAALTLFGCTTPLQRRVQEDHEALSARAAVHRETLRNPVETDEIWLGGEAFELRETPPLPPALKRRADVIRERPQTLRQLGDYIAEISGLRVEVAPAATQFADAEPALGTTAPGDVQGLPGTLQIGYSGDVAGLLDHIAARTGSYWHLTDQRTLRIDRYQTKTWQIAGFPLAMRLDGVVTNQSQLRSGSGGGEESGPDIGAGQSTQLSGSLDLFASLGATLPGLLSTNGSVAIDTATGMVTARDYPAIIEALDAHIVALNHHLLQQVAIEVQVLSVELDDADAYGLDLDVLYSNGERSANLAVFGDPPLAANFAGLAVPDPSDRFTGSTAVINALRTQGTVSVETTATVVALSYQPIPLQRARQTGFLAEVSTELVADAGVSTRLTADTVTSGFTLRLLPIVLSGQEVLLQTEVNLSDLRDLVDQVSGNNRIQTPIQDIVTFTQRNRLRSGQTLVMTGFDQTESRSELRSAGKPNWWALGGSSRNDRRRTVLVVLLTPRVLT